MDDFVLPDKWVIKRTPENWKIVVDYFNSLGASYTYYNLNYPYVCNYEGRNDSREFSHPGYTEITFEQFQKYVLNQDYDYEEVNPPEDMSYLVKKILKDLNIT